VQKSKILQKLCFSLILIMFRFLFAASLALAATAFAPSGSSSRFVRSKVCMQGDGLKIDMKGKTVFIGGVADSTGYGWAIAKACAEAGAKILLGTWPPVLPIFQMGIDRGQFAEDSKLSDGSTMEITKVRYATII
jgi:enoyl-[acyl-carrier protein] reductase I